MYKKFMGETGLSNENSFWDLFCWVQKLSRDRIFRFWPLNTFFFISMETLPSNLKTIRQKFKWFQNMSVKTRWEFQKLAWDNSVSPKNAKYKFFFFCTISFRVSPKFQVDVKKSYWFWLWNSSGLYMSRVNKFQIPM